MIVNLTWLFIRFPELPESRAAARESDRQHFRAYAFRMAKAVQTGPQVANDGDMSVAQIDKRYRELRTSQLVTARGSPGMLAALSVFDVGVFVWARYPAGRLAAVIAVAVVIVGSELWFTFRRGRSNDGHLGNLLRFFFTLALCPLTGGVRSPFVAVLLIPVSDIVIATGWSRTVKMMLAILAATLVATAVLPDAWFGPDLPHPAYGLVLVATLAAGVVWHTRYVVGLTRAMAAMGFQLRRAREEVVERAMTRARDMEQLAAKLSHELKNPLTAIKGLVQLTSRSANDPDSREQLSVVATEVGRMEEILKEYLSFSRPLKELQPRPVRLGALADDVLAAMEGRAASAGVALRRSGEASVEADPRRLKEALFNLVGNALEATPRGGTVEVNIEDGDGMARIAVRDSGHGMPKDVLERLGTPFFTTREEGTGLGVTVARAAFLQHGGSLVYSSEPGRGTTALGTLPSRTPSRSSHVAGPVG